MAGLDAAAVLGMLTERDPALALALKGFGFEELEVEEPTAAVVDAALAASKASARDAAAFKVRYQNA